MQDEKVGTLRLVTKTTSRDAGMRRRKVATTRLSPLETRRLRACLDELLQSRLTSAALG
jgi:hypothetical protein